MLGLGVETCRAEGLKVDGSKFETLLFHFLYTMGGVWFP